MILTAVTLLVLPLFLSVTMIALHLGLIACELSRDHITLLHSSEVYANTFFDTFYFFASAKKWRKRMLTMIFTEASCLTAITWTICLYAIGEKTAILPVAAIALCLFIIAFMLNIHNRHFAKLPLFLALHSSALVRRVQT